MHSNLNARLLMQYSNSLGKKTSIVSPDPRTQGTAIETGFDTFGSMAAFEGGHALERAVAAHTAGSPIAAGALGAAAVNDIPAAPTRRPTATPGPVAVPRPRPVAARPPAVAAASEVHVKRQLGPLPWVLGAVGVFLVAVILLFFVLPSAIVTIVVSARPVSVAPTITGSTQAPPGDQPLAVQTALQQAQEQQQQQVTSTGQKVIPAAAATGAVIFTYQSPVFGIGSIDFPKNTEVGTDDGKKYVTQADSGQIDAGHSSSPVPVVARGGGAGGNVAAGAIKNITNNPDSSKITVTNPNPTGGGADPQTKTVVAQSDIDKVRQTLGDQLSQKVKDDLKAKAGKDTILTDTQTVDVSVAADKQPGDEAPNFNETVTVKGKATSVSDARVKEILLTALKRTVTPGYHLTDDPPKLDYKEVQHDDNGGVVWDATATGFQATAVNESDLRGKIAGKSPKDAATYVKGHYDAQSSSVTISPPFVPWLPFNGGNIKFRTQVENTTPG
jgi:hypothetical protein